MKNVLLIICLLNLLEVKGQHKVSPVLPEVLSEFSNVRDFTMGATADELYFTVQSPLAEISSIVTMRKKDGKWLPPEVASFSGKYHDMEPFLSPDGLKLYFASNRPLDESTTETKDYDIWMVARKNPQSSWSAAMNLGQSVNTNGNEFYPSISSKGNLYITSDGPLSKGKDDIFICKWNNGYYEAPVSLSDSINSEGYEFNAYIASDESYLLFTAYNRKGGLGSGDLYISYSNGTGQWTAAKNLGEEVNSAQMDYCPFVHLQSNTLYFTSKRSGIKPGLTTTSTIEDIRKMIKRYDNGFSRLYKVSFKPDL